MERNIKYTAVLLCNSLEDKSDNMRFSDMQATETVAAYPDICFVVDDFDDTFNEVVMPY